MIEIAIILAIASFFTLLIVAGCIFRYFAKKLVTEDVLPLTNVNRSPPPPPPHRSPAQRSPTPLLPPLPSLTSISSTSLPTTTPPTPRGPPTPPPPQDLPFPPTAAAVIGRSRVATPTFEPDPARAAAAAAAIIARSRVVTAACGPSLARAAVMTPSRVATPTFDPRPARASALSCLESQIDPTRGAYRAAERASLKFQKTQALRALHHSWDIYPIAEYDISEPDFAPCQLVRPRSGMKPPCPDEPGGFF